MPRGNLETVYPRALVLAGIRSFIDAKEYRSAYLACRSQMVDMNILHDYTPQQFMENVPLFITQVKRVDYIDEFLSRLKYVYFHLHIVSSCWLPGREEDVSQTLYKDTLKLSKAEADAAAKTGANPAASLALKASKDSKINRICDAFLVALKNKMDTNLQNVVTAHVCKFPPDLDAGLQLVADLRGLFSHYKSELSSELTQHSAESHTSRRSYWAYVLLDWCPSSLQERSWIIWPWADSSCRPASANGIFQSSMIWSGI